MISLAELERRINNVCQIGTISEVYTTQRPKDHYDYALFAKVDIMGRTTDFFPVMAQMGEFKKHYCPPYVGEQVMVMCPFGNANMGYIMRGVYSHDKEPITHSIKDRTTEYVEYKDDTKAEISLKDEHIKLVTPNKIIIRVENSKPIEIFAEGKVSIESNKDIALKCKNAKVEASESIELKSSSYLKIDASNCSLDEVGNLTVEGTIGDMIGDLTFHTHEVLYGTLAVPRT